jgi:hypothetical protein
MKSSASIASSMYSRSDSTKVIPYDHARKIVNYNKRLAIYGEFQTNPIKDAK